MRSPVHFASLRRCALAALFAAGLAGLLYAAPPPARAADSVAHDMSEETRQLNVTVKDLYGRQETRQIPVTVFRPRGDGPFPLVIMNHGRAPADRRARQGIQRFEALSRYLIGKGFAVLLPTRVGYAQTYGEFDPEYGGGCREMRPEATAQAASDQVLATLAFAKTLPFVDTLHWIVMGQSVGGLATVATVARHPVGLLGGVNFSGGTGGDPVNRPGDPCSPQRVASLWKAEAADAAVPMLWLYWENDQFWGASVPRNWHEAWTAGGGRAEFHQLAAAGSDGHGGVNIDMDHWVPYVEAFLGQLGFNVSGLIARPPASAYATVDQIDKVPLKPAGREARYRRFLEMKLPRALAIGPGGESGIASGDWAMGRALGFCAGAGAGGPCRLYAVDDDVVWTP